jgi:hypothetical protein
VDNHIIRESGASDNHIIVRVRSICKAQGNAKSISAYYAVETLLAFALEYAASAAASAEAAAISSFMASVKSGLAGMLTASALMAAAEFKTEGELGI